MRIPLSEYCMLEFLLYSITNDNSNGGNYIFCSDYVLRYTDPYDSIVENTRLKDVEKMVFE